MSEAPSGQQNRQILDRIAAAITQIAAQENRRPVEQTGTLLLCLFEVLVELVTIIGAEIRSQRLRLVADIIKNAPPVFETPHLGLDFISLAFQEQSSKHLRRRNGRRQQRPGSCPRQPGPFTREAQAGETRLAATVIGRELVQRDRIAKPRPPSTRLPGQITAEPAKRFSPVARLVPGPAAQQNPR